MGKIEKECGVIKILLIEDDPFLLSMYSTKFEIEGYTVACADDGAKGLKMASIENPNIILLDIMMPKMNGFEVLEGLKKQDKTKSIPVILLTNLSDAERVAESLSQGVFDYLVKSDWKLENIVKKVKEKLGIE